MGYLIRRPKRQVVYGLVAASGLILAAILLLPAIHQPILQAIGNFLVVQDELQPADLIHILGGGYPDRLDHGAALYRAGYAPLVFATGSRRQKQPAGCDSPEYLVCRGGVAPEHLFPDRSGATSTYQEALELGRFLATRPNIRSVIVVSDPYHMRRAQFAFEQVNGSRVHFLYSPTLLDQNPWSQRDWWRSRSTRRHVLQEYLKLARYIWLYG